MAISRKTNLDDAQYEWYSTHLTVKPASNAPTSEIKRAYYAEQVGVQSTSESIAELELRWLRTLIGVSKAHNDLDRAWREAVAGANLTPQPSTDDNKLLYFNNVA